MRVERQRRVPLSGDRPCVVAGGEARSRGNASVAQSVRVLSYSYRFLIHVPPR